MKTYKTTVGLEIHTELTTNSKMFCGCANDPHHSKENENVCPICMGHPGTLPVINKEAVKKVLQVGVALGSKLADFTEFDRKNYFYPDIPKGYQISQYKFPLVTGGELAGVKITRIHLEEDTASSSHIAGLNREAVGRTDLSDKSVLGDYSLIDFNRAGVPLMELVTEPVITSAEQAGNFGRELQLLLRYLGVASANMEKGEMRVEANISVSDTDKLGTKVEVKNINSFRAVERAITYEVARHIEMLERGEKIVQETRGWDDSKQKTFSQRAKEDSHDYRYFPDPDLPKLKISLIPEFSRENLKKDMPELPNEKRVRFARDFAIKQGDIELYVTNISAGAFFETVSKEIKDKKSLVLASNYISSDLIGLISKDKTKENAEEVFEKLLFTPKSFANLIRMIEKGDVSSRGAKDILTFMYEKGGEPKDIADKNGLIQKSDPEHLKKIAEDIILANPKVVEDYKKGKEAALMNLLGLAMRSTKGSANPEMLKNIFKSIIS